MTKTIQDIILKWIGEDKKINYIANCMVMTDAEAVAQNKALADLRAKSPELAKEIVEALGTLYLPTAGIAPHICNKDMVFTSYPPQYGCTICGKRNLSTN